MDGLLKSGQLGVGKRLLRIGVGVRSSCNIYRCQEVYPLPSPFEYAALVFRLVDA